MENNLNKLLQLEGTPNDTAVEVLAFAKKALQSNNEVGYLELIIVLQGKMASPYNPPRMIEEKYDVIFQELLNDLLNTDINYITF